MNINELTQAIKNCPKISYDEYWKNVNPILKQQQIDFDLKEKSKIMSFENYHKTFDI